jgi:N-acetylglucosamine-6-phosphate deacetylase
MRKLKIINGRIITPESIIENGSLLISDGIITEISDKEISSNADIIDAEGNFISPGFIDIHVVHGGGGSDFMDGTIRDFLTIAETHLQYGTTALVPTTLTAEKENLLYILDIYRKAAKQNVKGAQFLGMHIEGP